MRALWSRQDGQREPRVDDGLGLAAERRTHPAAGPAMSCHHLSPLSPVVTRCYGRYGVSGTNVGDASSADIFPLRGKVILKTTRWLTKAALHTDRYGLM